jgi:hypothetical protein
MVVKQKAIGVLFASIISNQHLKNTAALSFQRSKNSFSTV